MIFCLAYAVTTLGFTAALVLACWRRLKGRTAQKISHWQLRATLLLWMPIVLRLAVPCPLLGNYIGNVTFDTEDDYHTHVRFSDGRADFITCHRGHARPVIEHWGRYEKTGWNTYLLMEDNPKRQIDVEPFPITLHVGWFFVDLSYAPESRHVMKEDELCRDFHILRWMP